MKKALVLASVMAAVTTGCTTGLTPIPDPSSTAAQLYIGKCSACHALPHPKRNNYREWQHLLVLMQQRMAERGMPALTVEEKETLLGYLKRHAR
ncbi:hypothetical protein MNBD_GAMMA26-1477 [hydrothermal vent metagenome]|uniref:Cytochrome c domain-containing protein n=1 Tax=hydrothermal vent metagenome TaxID=652676 RepID=A0A3B1AV87_9ZZZZ